MQLSICLNYFSILNRGCLWKQQWWLYTFLLGPQKLPSDSLSFHFYAHKHSFSNFEILSDLWDSYIGAGKFTQAVVNMHTMGKIKQDMIFCTEYSKELMRDANSISSPQEDIKISPVFLELNKQASCAKGSYSGKNLSSIR